MPYSQPCSVIHWKICFSVFNTAKLGIMRAWPSGGQTCCPDMTGTWGTWDLWMIWDKTNIRLPEVPLSYIWLLFFNYIFVIISKQKVKIKKSGIILFRSVLNRIIHACSVTSIIWACLRSTINALHLSGCNRCTYVSNYAYFGEILRVPAQADQWTSVFTKYNWGILHRGYLLILDHAVKWIQHSVLTMVLQHSGHKANGSPVPLLRGKIKWSGRCGGKEA